MSDRNDLVIAIPFDTWMGKKYRLLERFPHLREEDLHFVEGQEDHLIGRLQALLVMARRAVVDLIRNA